MKNYIKSILAALLMCSFTFSFAQDYETRVIHNGGGELIVEARYVGTGTPPQGGADAFLDLVLDLRFPVSGDISLGAVDNTAGYGIAKVGSETVDPDDATVEFQQFQLSSAPAFIGSSWVLNEWEEIFKVTDTNYDGAGEEVSVGEVGTNPNNPNIPNFNMSGVDFVPIINGAAILPIKLHSFSATKDRDNVKLDWITESEVNGSHFDVQRSSDLESWTTIGTVEAVGESSSKQAYALIDDRVPLNTRGTDKTFYYRLNMVDNDESQEYSEIRVVRFDQQEASFIVYPNPSHNEVFVNLSSITAETGPATMNVVNMQGALVKNVQLATNDDISIDISTLQAGAYFFLVKQGEETFAQKVIKVD